MSLKAVHHYKLKASSNDFRTQEMKNAKEFSNEEHLLETHIGNTTKAKSDPHLFKTVLNHLLKSVGLKVHLTERLRLRVEGIVCWPKRLQSTSSGHV